LPSIADLLPEQTAYLVCARGLPGARGKVIGVRQKE
jgi:hypothetical protein